MTVNLLRMSLAFVLLTLLAACGSAPLPVWEAAEAETAAALEAAAEAHEDGADEVAQLPTATPTELPPTATPTELPPTATPTDMPPTATPTEEVAAAPSDPIVALVTLANAANGEAIFNQDFETEIGVWQCANCHNVDNPEVKVGPSLLGVPQHAAERVEGEIAQRYIYNSIMQPQAYIVEGFEEGQQMPPNYSELLSDTQVYDLVAYLMTLNAE